MRVPNAYFFAQPPGILAELRDPLAQVIHDYNRQPERSRVFGVALAGYAAGLNEAMQRYGLPVRPINTRVKGIGRVGV